MSKTVKCDSEDTDIDNIQRSCTSAWLLMTYTYLVVSVGH